jgi:hypothetical protein
MTFHRFENYEARTRAVHLSTGQTRKIVGNYIFFGHVKKMQARDPLPIITPMIT